MTVRLGQNIESLRAQRQLSNATARVSKSFERLSSGVRINHAADDPAGLSVANQLGSKSRVLTTAVRNINDGISISNIVTGALSAQQGILARMSELAEQSANGVYSTAQRKALNTEYESLIAEFGRISQTTSFNGVQLLQGPATQVAFQVGADGSTSSQISISSANLSPLTGVIAGSGDYNGSGSVDIFDLNSVLPVLSNITVDQMQKIAGGSLLHFTITDSLGRTQNTYVAPYIYNYGGSGGISLLMFGENSGGDFSVVGSSSSSPLTNIQTVNGTYSNGGTASISLDLSQLTVNPLVGAAGQQVSQITGGVIGGSGIYASKSSIDFTGVETQLRAQDALTTIQNRSADVSALQGSYGAVENRLGIALNVAHTMSDNYQAAASRILDADVADESAQLTKNLVLQQAAESVLAQANLNPRIALDLLSR